jgi:hypothetical protein
MNYSIPAEALSKAFMELAKPIADMKGLEWKVWIHDSKNKMAGGIYPLL